jgi:hypothetical protein
LAPTIRFENVHRRVGPERAEYFGLRAQVEVTNGTYFSVTPFAILCFISARGLVSQP